MVWYEDLYVGRLAQTRRDALISGIDSGNYPAGAWLITVPDNPLRQLEIKINGFIYKPIRIIVSPIIYII